MKNKVKLCCICGPTASGKTSVSIALALKFNGEIISADSMQIYRELSISTAKPTEDEMRGIRHHLLGHVSVGEDYSVARYVSEASEIIADVDKRGKLPIIVGGTGLYIDSLINNIAFSSCKTDYSLREKLKKEAAEKGNDTLLKYLSEFDPITSSRLHVNDLNRIIRAIEIYELTGVTMSRQIELSKSTESPFDVCKIGITFSNRDDLYERINKRVDKMLKEGLLDEAKTYYDLYKGINTSSQAIGIKELFDYFDGKLSLEECVENIKMETRRYAKRQISWFKRDKNTTWFDMSEPDAQKNIINFVKNYW